MRWRAPGPAGMRRGQRESKRFCQGALIGSAQRASIHRPLPYRAIAALPKGLSKTTRETGSDVPTIALDVVIVNFPQVHTTISYFSLSQFDTARCCRPYGHPARARGRTYPLRIPVYGLGRRNRGPLTDAEDFCGEPASQRHAEHGAVSARGRIYGVRLARLGRRRRLPEPGDRPRNRSARHRPATRAALRAVRGIQGCPAAGALP
jgi:hypothetical protein